MHYPGFPALLTVWLVVFALSNPFCCQFLPLTDPTFPEEQTSYNETAHYCIGHPDARFANTEVTPRCPAVEHRFSRDFHSSQLEGARRTDWPRLRQLCLRPPDTEPRPEVSLI